MNKHNGETVAVKTFNQLSHMRPQEVQMREFEVLQKVKHENIVRYYGAWVDKETSDHCLVMELLGGGTLHERLCGPMEDVPWAVRTCSTRTK